MASNFGTITIEIKEMAELRAALERLIAILDTPKPHQIVLAEMTGDNTHTLEACKKLI